MRQNHRSTNNGKSRDDRFELRFQSLYDRGRALTFPCDAKGQVDIDGLSGTARHNLERARTRVGTEWSVPQVVRVSR